LQAGLTGRHSFAYFSVAVDRKVSRLEGENECMKAFRKNKINYVVMITRAFDLKNKPPTGNNCRPNP